MANFCRLCGAALPKDAVYCPQCGKPIPIEIPAPPGAEVIISDEPPITPEEPRNSSAKKAAVSHAPQPGAKKKKSGNRGVSLFLALILVVELAVAGFKYPGFLIPTKPEPYKTVLPNPTAGTSGSASATAKPAVPAATDSGGDSDIIDEEFVESDLFHTGTAGVDFALGQGPGTPGYQMADGYGVETVIAYSASEIASAPAVTVQVTAEEPVAHLDGITVDFGKENLNMQTGMLTVRSLPTKVDELNGYSAAAWDLELSGQEAFGFPVAVTIPYGDLGGRNPAAILLPQHYNEALGRWEYVSYEINVEEGTVTAYLTHFSPISIFESLLGWGKEEGEVLTSKQSRMLKLTTMPEEIKSSVRENQDLQKLVEKDFQSIVAQAKKEPSALFKKGGAMDILFRNTGNCLDALTLTFSLANYVEILGPSCAGYMGVIGLGYLVYDTGMNATGQFLKNKGDLWDKTKESAATVLKASPGFVVGLLGVKSASDAMLSLAPLWYTEPGLMLVAGAVMLTFGVIDANVNAEEVKEEPEAKLDQVYRAAPYKSLYWDKRTHEIIYVPNGWIDTDYIDVRIQRKQRQGLEPTGQPDPDSRILVKYGDEVYNTYYTEEFLEVYETFKARREALAAEGTRQVGVYWVDDYNIVPLGALYENTNDWWNPGWRAILNYIRDTKKDDPESWYPTLMAYMEKADEEAFAYAYDLGIFTGYPVANPTLTSADIISDLLSRLKERQMFTSFSGACLAAFDEKNIKNWQKMKYMQNREVKFLLKDKEGKEMTFSDTRFAGKYIVFDTNPKHYVLADPWVADMNNSTFMTCTYNGYLMAGSPVKLLVYNSEQAYRNGEKEIDTIEFKKVGEKAKTVTLKMKREKRPEASYRFDMVSNALGPGIIYKNDRPLIEEALRNTSFVLDSYGRFMVHGSASDSRTGERIKRPDYALLFDTDESKDKYAWSESSGFDSISVDLSGTFNTNSEEGACTLTGTSSGSRTDRMGFESGKVETFTTTYDGVLKGETNYLWTEHNEGKDYLIISFYYRKNQDGEIDYELFHDVSTTYSDYGAERENQGMELQLRFIKVDASK